MLPVENQRKVLMPIGRENGIDFDQQNILSLYRFAMIVSGREFWSQGYFGILVEAAELVKKTSSQKHELLS